MRSSINRMFKLISMLLIPSPTAGFPAWTSRLLLLLLMFMFPSLLTLFGAKGSLRGCGWSWASMFEGPTIGFEAWWESSCSWDSGSKEDKAIMNRGVYLGEPGKGRLRWVLKFMYTGWGFMGCWSDILFKLLTNRTYNIYK